MSADAKMLPVKLSNFRSSDNQIPRYLIVYRADIQDRSRELWVGLFSNKLMPFAFLFRHEVPVTSDPITIVHVDEDVVVVNKPASIPVSGIATASYHVALSLLLSLLIFIPDHRH